jgi:hypothetical protein
VLNQIEERPLYNKTDLLKKRKEYTNQVEYLTSKISDIDTLIFLSDIKPQYLHSLRRKRDEEIIDRLKELNENLHQHLMRSFTSDIKYIPSETNDLLIDLGIYCEKDYHLWLLKNHTDIELVNTVQRLCKNRGW